MLLKAKDIQHDAAEAKVFSLRDIAAEAQQLLAAAKQKANQMIRQAEDQIERARAQALEQAQQQGFQEGLEKGAEQGRCQALEQARIEFEQKTSQTLTTLDAVISEFDQAKHQILFNAEQHTIQFALAVAEKVTHKIAAADPDVALENVKAALHLLAQPTNVLIKIHPDVLEHIQNMNAQKRLSDNLESIAFEKDSDITPGGCIICTDQGQIDAQLETQLERIADELITKQNKDDEI